MILLLILSLSILGCNSIGMETHDEMYLDKCESQCENVDMVYRYNIEYKDSLICHCSFKCMKLENKSLDCGDK